MEIVKTEETYVRHLQFVVNGFMVPLQQAGLLNAEDKARVFSNVELILGVNQTILEQLKERTARWSFDSTCLGNVFLALSPFLRMYTSYINNYPQAVDTFQRLQQQPAFAQAVERCREECATAGGGGGLKLTFQDYQIMPIQRIPRYVLLVQELLKFTPAGHPDQAQLTSALDLLREVASKINEHRRWAENLEKLRELQQSITGFSEELVQPSRWLVHEGEVTRVQRGAQASSLSSYLFLFNDILVITERRRYMFEDKYYYTFKEQIALHNMFGGELEDDPNGFVLRTRYGVVESFLASSPAQRDEWVKRLETVIQDLRKSRASLRLDAGVHDLQRSGSSTSLRLSLSSASLDLPRRPSASNLAMAPAPPSGVPLAPDPQREDAHSALIAALSSLSVPSTGATASSSSPASSSSASSSPASSRPLSLAQPPPPSPPPLALVEAVQILNEALALERDLFQRPIELQSILPDYCRSIPPQLLQALGERLRLLHARLSELRVAQQRVKALLLRDEPLGGVRNLDSLIRDGRTSIGDLKTWVQQSFPPTAHGGTNQPRALMAALLKWYLALSEAWQAILAQPCPSS